MEVVALRTRSRVSRDLLTHLATGGRWNYAQLRGRLRELREVPGRQSLATWEPVDWQWMARLARVVGHQRLDAIDARDALDMYSALFDRGALAQAGPVHVQLYAELLCLLRHDETLVERLDALPLPDPLRARFRADVLNPHRGGPLAADESPWTDAVLTAITGRAEHDLALAPDDGTPAFDRLRGRARPGSVDGPLVTVVVTAFQPDDGLRVALDSILHQTWGNLEVLLVDDGSSPRHRALLEEVASTDHRVRLVEKPVNGGTYRARNTALDLARGDFLTFQDSDDWSHPRRIERQVRELLENPDLMATRSRCVRATDDLELSQPGEAPSRPNASSLLFRLRPVMGRIGYFDEVRKGADSEYHARIEAAFGRGTVQTLDRVLAVVRLSPGSLSRSEFRPGWRHRSRFFYRTSYEWWHRQVAAGADPFVPRSPARRPFPAPSRMLARRPARQRADVVLMGDWRLPSEARAMEAEAVALHRAGLSVGIGQIESLRHLAVHDEALPEAFYRLMDQGQARLHLMDDDLDVGLLVLRCPEAFQFPPAEPARWRVDDVWLCADAPPANRDGSDYRYRVDDVRRHCRSLFGRTPTWVPRDAGVRAALIAGRPELHVASFDHLGIWTVADGVRELGERVRVGCLWPGGSSPRDSDVDTSWMEQDPGFDVAVYASPPEVERLEAWSRAVAPHVRVVDASRTSLDAFFDRVDFLVHRPPSSAPPRAEDEVVTAICRGIMPVLPLRYVPVYGDAAVYAAASDLVETIRRLHADPRRHHRAVSVAQDLLGDRGSSRRFVERVRVEIDSHGTPGSSDAESSAAGPIRGAPPRFTVSMADWPRAPEGWHVATLGDARVSWHPSTSRIVRRMRGGDRLRDPYHVTVLGEPVDPDQPTHDPVAIAGRLGRAYEMDGVQGAASYVERLGGRFTCLVHDNAELLVLSDARGSAVGTTVVDDVVQLASHAAVEDADAVPSDVWEWASPDAFLRLTTHGGRASCRRVFPTAPPVASSQEAMEEARHHVVEHLRLLLDGGPTAIAIEPGRTPARLLAVAAKEAEVGSYAFVRIHEGIQASDLLEATGLAHAAGLPFRVLQQDAPVDAGTRELSLTPLATLASDSVAAPREPTADEQSLPPGWTVAAVTSWVAWCRNLAVLGEAGSPFATRRFGQLLVSVGDEPARLRFLEDLLESF